MVEKNAEIPGKKNPALPCLIMAVLCFVAGILWSCLDLGWNLSGGELTAAYWILGILCFFSCGEALFISIRNHGLKERENFEFCLTKGVSFVFGPIIGFLIFLIGRGVYWVTQNLDETWWEIKDWLSASFVETIIITGVIVVLIFFVIQNKKRTIKKFGKDRVE